MSLIRAKVVERRKTEITTVASIRLVRLVWKQNNYSNVLKEHK